MSEGRSQFAHIHVGDEVAMEVTDYIVGDEYKYEVHGKVRKYDGVLAVGRYGLGEGKILYHHPRPLPTRFGSHIRYESTGAEWVKTSGDYWRSDSGTVLRTDQLPSDWILVRDAGAEGNS